MRSCSFRSGLVVCLHQQGIGLAETGPFAGFQSLGIHKRISRGSDDIECLIVHQGQKFLDDNADQYAMFQTVDDVRCVGLFECPLGVFSFALGGAHECL